MSITNYAARLLFQNYLRELLRLMLPRFYAHLKKVQDGMELLFVHRYIFCCIASSFSFINLPQQHCEVDCGLNYICGNLITGIITDIYFISMYIISICSRWILLCFKREFPEVDALRMWQACWAHYQTDYFHLFICVAIISVYGEDVVEQDLPADEMLLHFSSLSMHMSGDVILKKVGIKFCW